MAVETFRGPSLITTIHRWWRENSARDGFFPTLKSFFSTLWEFARDSTPTRRRQRYGDVEYDWDFRVNTTGATVVWRDRLLGMFNSPYQPTEPALFHEMLASLRSIATIDLREFIFIDIGSGKGRALLMAADYPFRRIVGVELLPELHRVSKENIGKYREAIRSSASPSTVFWPTQASSLSRRSPLCFTCSTLCPSPDWSG